MKKKFLCIFSLLMFCAICLIGCGGFKLSGGPLSTDTVYGNGGSVVVKGDYMYFANAYIDYNNIGRYENKYNEDSSKNIYGIYRTKLNDFGVVSFDENGNPIGAELMVPQVGGYAYSGLYICGDYLYYTTPYTGDNKGTEVKGLISFDRVKLDGSEHQVIHTMTDYSSSCKYSINYIDGATYITIFDTNSNLQVVKVVGGNISKYDGSAYQVFASNVDSYLTMTQTEIVSSNNVENVNKYVYYTKKDGNSYYSLCRKSLINLSENEEILIASTKDVIKLVEIKNNRVYYIQNNVLLSSTFEQDTLPKAYTSLEVKDGATTGVVSYKILNDTIGSGSVDRGVVVVFNDGTNYSVSIVKGSETNYLFNKQKQITILNVLNDNIYYQVAEDEALYVYNTSLEKETKLASSFSTSVADSVSMYDFDEERAFYFATAQNTNGNLKYLHMVSLNSNYSFENADGQAVGKYVGVIDSSDKI